LTAAFDRAGIKHANLKLVLPFLISSMPMAYFGGALKIPKEIFYWILLLSLIFVAARIYVWKNTTIKLNFNQRKKIIISLIAGSILGLVSGIVGIGGGIYLVPLIIAVLSGGALGSFMGSFKYSPRAMEKMLGAVIILAIFFLTKKAIAF
jgi:uncharacterized membrane protein YfcA